MGKEAGIASGLLGVLDPPAPHHVGSGEGVHSVHQLGSPADRIFLGLYDLLRSGQSGLPISRSQSYTSLDAEGDIIGNMGFCASEDRRVTFFEQIDGRVKV